MRVPRRFVLVAVGIVATGLIAIGVVIAVGGDGEDALAIPPAFGACEKYEIADGLYIGEMYLPIPTPGAGEKNVIVIAVPTPTGPPIYQTNLATGGWISKSFLHFFKDTGKLIREGYISVDHRERLRAAVAQINEQCG